MPLVAPTDVQAVLAAGKDYDSDLNPDLTPYINAADGMVQQVVQCAARRGVTLTPTQQAVIEAWLAAHLYCMSDQTYRARTTSKASGQFGGDWGLNLDGTKYGQSAAMYDISGCLNAYGKRLAARAAWLGKNRSTMIPVDERASPQ
jgi:hypothetical protein